MKVSIEKVLSTYGALDSLLKQPLSGALMFKLGKYVRKFKTEVDEFNKNKVTIYQKYGGKTTGQFIALPKDIKPEVKELFGKDLQELLDGEVDIDCIDITVDDIIKNLENVDKLVETRLVKVDKKVTTQDIMAFDWIFSSPKDATKKVVSIKQVGRKDDDHSNRVVDQAG